MTIHTYQITLNWQGNLTHSATGYTDYSRNFLVSHLGKENIYGSADRVSMGDPTRWNPEQLLIAAASACHKLWYLHLCAVNHLHVTHYVDDAYAEVQKAEDGKKGQIIKIVLCPQVTFHDDVDITLALQLHQDAYAQSVIANAISTPLVVQPHIQVE